MAQLYICTEAFVSNRRDKETWVLPSQVAEAGSWPLEVSPRSFMPLAIDYPAPGSDLNDQKPKQRHPRAQKSDMPDESSESAPKAAV